MELRHLRYFVAVAEEENVTRAAVRLHVSQPGLSRQVRDLEDEIGFPLLQRKARSVRLTEAGRRFLVEARAVLQHADDAVKAARAVASGIAEEIHVGYAPSLTVQILPQALRTFQAEFPGVRVMLHDLSTEEMIARLHEGKLQLALAVQPSRKMLRRLRFVELARYPLCVAVAPGHPLARLRKVSLAQVVGEPLIVYTRKDYPEYHESLEMLFKPGGHKPRIAEEHDGVTSLIAAVEAGRGVALVPSCLACMAGPRLKLIPLAPAGRPIVVGAAWREGEVPVHVEKFIASASAKTDKYKIS
jgi:LysR family transcriptional regulator, benzoate and cis,cis-muconate-responsive activator of ben and cat genes